MTIDQAIEILNRDRFDNPDYNLLDFQEAIDLVNDLVARYPRNSILKNDLKILEELLQK